MAPTRADILAAATAGLTDSKRADYARRLGQYRRWCRREGIERPIPCSPASYRKFIGEVRARERGIISQSAETRRDDRPLSAQACMGDILALAGRRSIYGVAPVSLWATR